MTKVVSGKTPKTVLPKIGLLLHVFYLEGLPSLLRVVPHFPADITLLVSAPEKHLAEVEKQLRAAAPRAKLHIKVVPNIGFDIAPMLICFAQQLLELDLVCKLHTKDSLRYQLHKGWREHLLHNLAGSAEIVADIQTRFSANPRLGVLLAGACPTLKASMQWNDKHLDVVYKLLDELKLPVESILDFPAGAIFWFRPAVLEPLLRKSWAWNDFEFEGSEGIAHVIERLILLLADQQGFTWLKMDKLAHSPTPIMSKELTLLQPKIAVVLHIWALDGLAKAIAALKNIPQRFDLFVTLSSNHGEKVSAVLEQHFNVNEYHFFEIENVGHDLAPFLGLGAQLLEYDLVCKLHLKQSSVKFDYLLNNLLGGVVEVNIILAMFARNENLGMVYPACFPPAQGGLIWGDNYAKAQRIAAALSLPELDPLETNFLSSTMFWCRPQGLRKLFDYSGFHFTKADNALLDGAESHAVERLILLCNQDAGYAARSVLQHPYIDKKKRFDNSD
jgi:lipopolysaccharide biosynthesis protein